MRFEVHKSVPTNENNVTTPVTSQRRPGVSGQGNPPEPGERPAESAKVADENYLGVLPGYLDINSGRRFSESNVIDEEVEKLEHEDARLLTVNDSYQDTQASKASNARSVRSASDAPYAHIGRLYANRQTSRLVYKDGSCAVTSKNVGKRRKRYLVDIFTTFVDMRWRYNLAMFGIAFIGTWFFFTLLWWGTAVLHKDHHHVNDSDWNPCVEGVFDFTTALLYSIETQQTIGYGTRAIHSHCPHATLILMLQSCVGVFIQSLMTGLIFAKLSRPKGRAQTLMFSRKAVICQRDGQYCLLFRLGDMRKSHIIGTSIRALIVKDRITREGEKIPLCQYNLKLETETDFSDGFVFLVWPVTVVHRIDRTSPLWEMSAESLITEQFEIIVIMEGNLESTGNSAQFRTSYLPTEILWGQRLSPLFTYHKSNGQYEIDFSQFHNVVPVDSMPTCSAQEHEERRRAEGTPTGETEKFFPANFTIQDSRSSTRYPSIIRRKFSRVKRSSLVPPQQSASQSAVDGGRHSIDIGVMGRLTPEPTSKRSKHFSGSNAESQGRKSRTESEPGAAQRRSSRTESGSDAAASAVASNNNTRSRNNSKSDMDSSLPLLDTTSTSKTSNGGNLYANHALLSVPKSG